MWCALHWLRPRISVSRPPTEEEVSLLYHDIGKGVWHLQYVEYALNTLIALRVDIREPGRVTHEAAQAALAKHRGGVLGNSVKTARDNSLLPIELEQELSAFIAERNWLIHRSIDSHGELLYTEAGRTETFARLEKFISDAKALQHGIAEQIEQFAESQGVSARTTEAAAHAKIAKLRGEP